jgi:hypothetical protein
MPTFSQLPTGNWRAIGHGEPPRLRVVEIQAAASSSELPAIGPLSGDEFCA